MRPFGHIIVFASYLSYLYRFTVNPGCIARLPLQDGCTKTFYTSTSASAASLSALRFLLQRSIMVWYGSCQRNCKSQLHPAFSNSETKFWFQFVGRSPDELSQRHAPGLSLSSVCVAKSNHRHGPMPWLPSSSIKIINYHQNRSSLTGGSCPHQIGPRVEPGQVNEIIRKYRMLTGPVDSCHQSQTYRCNFTICVPEMNWDGHKQWSAAREFA